MMELLWPMSLGDWLGWLGLFFAIAFGLLSIYFYIRSQRFRQFGFVLHQTVVQTSAHPDVIIHFRGEQISNLVRTRIAWLSIGDMAIRGTDMPSKLPPTIQVANGSRILSVATIAVVNPLTGFSASLTDQQSVKVTFEYLNKGDGGVIELLLEGTGDLEKLQAVPIGEIIDGRDYALRRFYGKEGKFGRAGEWLAIAAGFILLWLAAKGSGLVVAMMVTGVFRYLDIAAAFTMLLVSIAWTHIAATTVVKRSKQFSIPRVIEDAMAENQMKSTVPRLSA